MTAKESTAAAALRRIRESQGRSLRAVAGELGVTPSQLSRVERGERSYNRELGSRLAGIYGVPPEMLNLFNGQIPADIVEIMQMHPHLIDDLRKRYGGRQSGEDVGKDFEGSLD